MHGWTCLLLFGVLNSFLPFVVGRNETQFHTTQIIAFVLCDRIKYPQLHWPSTWDADSSQQCLPPSSFILSLNIQTHLHTTQTIAFVLCHRIKYPQLHWPSTWGADCREFEGVDNMLATGADPFLHWRDFSDFFWSLCDTALAVPSPSSRTVYGLHLENHRRRRLENHGVVVWFLQLGRTLGNGGGWRNKLFFLFPAKLKKEPTQKD